VATSRNPGGTKNRGRAKIRGNDTTIGNKGALQLEKRTDTNRPITAGGGKNRGDRRDMSKAYTNSTRTSRSGTNPPGKGGSAAMDDRGQGQRDRLRSGPSPRYRLLSRRYSAE